MMTSVYADGAAETATPAKLVDAQLAGFSSALASGTVAPPFQTAVAAVEVKAALGETVTRPFARVAS